MERARVLRGCLLVALAALLWLTCSATAHAAETRTGGEITVAAGEVIEDDLYIAGGDVEIAGTVRGDVTAAAGDLLISGRIEGGLTVVSGAVEVTGVVTGSVRVLSGDLTIGGEVGRDVIAGAGNVTVLAAGSVGGDVLTAGANVELLGPVGGRVAGYAEELTINAPVGDDVDVMVEQISLLSRTRIDGDLSYESDEVAGISDGASVAGEIERTERSSYGPGRGITGWLSSPLFRLLAALMAGVMFVLLIPRAATSVADAVRLAPFTSFLFGIMLAFLLPILVGILIASIAGIPIAFILLLVLVSVLYLSQVFLGLAIGRVILPSSWDVNGRGYNLLAMVLGVCILGGLRMIPLPFISSALAAITAVVGLGAVMVAIRASRRRTVVAA